MKRLLIALAAAFLLATMTMAAAHAACEPRHRIPHGESECLSAEWKNHRPTVTNVPWNWGTARSSCSDLGRVVAKVDLRGTSDRIWHLHDNNVRRHNTSARIRHVYCCRDLGVCHRPR